MKGSAVIIKKELYRVFSDKKLIFSLFLLPAILVVGIYSLMGTLATSMIDDVETHISSVYIVNCPEEAKQVIDTTDYKSMADISYMTESEYGSQKSDLEAKILEGNVDLLVYFAPEFMDDIALYSKEGDRIPVIEVSYNSTENYSSSASSTFSDVVIEELKTSLLAKRFGNLEQLTVFDTQSNEIVKEDKARGEFLSTLLPYLITMLLFASAMGIGMDAIAGEKERGTLSSLLLSPVKRSDIVVGKLVSLSILSGLSSIVYAVAMVIAAPSMGKIVSGGAQMSVSFSLVQVLELFAIMLSLVYLYVGFISLLSVLAKDMKEASTYISPMYIIVIIAGMVTMFTMGSEIPLYRYAIPVYGNALAIKDLVVNELAVENFLVSLGGTVLLSIIVTIAVTKAFNSEKVMFNA